jgi:hypothetical protein
MNAGTKPRLPPNPYKLSPIKKLEDLAGRARERKTIRYYLNLTASGDSPHLALIGQRGVGKTSLLNGAESIARDLKLLPVRLDMNELKAGSLGRFWHDLYQTLALSMVKVGCWGGEQGAIYAELLRMIHSRQPGSLEKAVMQIPYVFSCHQGSIDTFECPDALVVNDFKACLTELQSKGFTGIALLIDEADCLGKNVPLLQMFRNIFQIVEHCSLLLAGTEAVFPALSEVFSPIPRQFHRVDVMPFARWSDTMELVLRPIPKDLVKSVAPTGDVLEELHELCGGAPDEIQLYCHHMYRSVEDGSSPRMSLSPQVFREVLREYRSNTPANVDAVLNAIERLPDKLLFQSKWLSRRNLTLEENIRVSVLIRELKRDEPLSSDERRDVASELTDGYRKLFEAGVTEIDNCIQLAGAPLSAGFWKSFVEVEKNKRWSWDDDSFAENLRQPILWAIGKACDGFVHIEPRFGDNAKQALLDLRAGKAVPDVDESMGEMILSALITRERNITHAVDVAFHMDSPAGRQKTQARVFEKPGREIRQEQIDQWIETHKTMLAGNDISIAAAGFGRWVLPTSEELHRLGRISGYRIPEVFGPNEGEQALSKFGMGDIPGCMDTFVRMLVDKEEPQVRNNLAFCQIVTGDVAAGLDNATKATASDYEPLYELNKGVAEFLQGDIGAAKESLRNALKELHTPENTFFADASYVLVIDPTEKKATPHEDLLVEVAILINLWRLVDLPRDELEAALTRLVPKKAQSLLAAFTTP